MMKKLARTLILTSAAAVAIVLFVRASGDQFFEISKNLDIFVSLYREINTNYVDDTKPGELMKTGIDAMLETLDPYTNFIPESQIEDYRFMTTGQYGGIGALIQRRDDNIYITETYDDFPAQEAGIFIGDRILEIDGNKVTGKNTEEISNYLKGQPATSVNIKLERGHGDQAKIMEKKIQRAEIKIKDVPFYGVMPNNVGYIKLTQFTSTASAEFSEALKELKEKKHVDKLIVDLRGNGGGLLVEAVNIVNLFVDKGTPVVSTKGKLREWDQSYKAQNNPYDLRIPIVILVDENSASASEIVAGAIQDLDRGVILGRPTYGKGLVQQTVDLSYNSKLKVTVAKYYTPSGRCIQKLDYASRDSHGDVSEIPDSLIREFKSLHSGRPLFDGKGIKPDVEMKEEELSNIALGLIQDYHIFDYATDYRLTHDKIDAPEVFTLSEADLNDFKTYLAGQKFTYSTNAEKLLDELKKSTEKEHYYAAISNQYLALKDELINVKSNDFEKHADQIRTLLSNELVLRYYHIHGQIAYALRNDDYVKEAQVLLNDAERYSRILSGDTKNSD